MEGASAIQNRSTQTSKDSIRYKQKNLCMHFFWQNGLVQGLYAGVAPFHARALVVHAPAAPNRSWALPPLFLIYFCPGFSSEEIKAAEPRG